MSKTKIVLLALNTLGTGATLARVIEEKPDDMRTLIAGIVVSNVIISTLMYFA